MRYIVTEKIESPVKVAKGIELHDFFFVVIYIALSFGFMSAVHEKLKVIYMIFSLFMAIFLTSKSSFNKQRRNYESIFLMLRKDTAVYKPFIRKEDPIEKER